MSINKEVLFKTLEYTTSNTGTKFKVWEANSDQYAITTYIQGSNWSCSIDVDNNGRWKVNDAKETESNAVKFSHSNKALYISCSSSTSLMSRIEIKYGTIKPVLPSVITSISGSLQTIPNGTSISKETVNDLNVTGNTNISSSFNVQGNTSVNANANLNSNLTVIGNTSVSQNANLNSDLTVTGNTTVSLNANLNSDLTVNGNTSVSQNANLNSDLTVTGNTTVSLNANLNSDLTVNGNTIVTNSANLNNGLSVNTGLTLVKNSATLNDGLNVTNGLTTVNGTLGANLNKGLNVTESTFVGTTASLNGSLTVTKDTSVSADANLNSNLTVGGNTNVAKDLSVTGNTNVSQIANLNSNLTVFGNTEVSLNANLNSNLTVIGNTSVGTSTKSANAQLDGDLFVTGTTNVKTCASFCHGILVEGPVVINGIYDDSDPDKYSAIFNKGVNTSNALVTGNLNTTNLTVSQNVDVTGSLNIGPNSSLNINQIYTTSDNLTIGTSLPVGDNSALSVFIKDGKYYYLNDAGAAIEITESTYNELKDKFTLKIDGNLYTNNIIVQGTQIASGLATNLQKTNANSNILYQKEANETELATGLIYNDTNSELTTLQIQQPKQTNSNNGIVFTARSDNYSSIELKYNNSMPLLLRVDDSGESLVQSACFNGKINNSETADTIVTTVTGSNSTYFIPFVSSSAAVSTGATMYVGGSASTNYNVTFNPSTGVLTANKFSGSKSISAQEADFTQTIITTNFELTDEDATLDVYGSQSSVVFNGTLSVNSTTNLNGNTNVAKDLTVTGNTNVYKDLTVCGNLIVKGNTTTVNTTELSIQDTFLELGIDDKGTITNTPVGFFTRTSSTQNTILAINDSYGYIGSQTSSLNQEEIVTHSENRIITEGNIESSNDTITINSSKTLKINNVEQAKSLVDDNYDKYNVGSSTGSLIYFSNGIPTAQRGTIGSANQLIYLKNGVLTAGNSLPVIPSLSIDTSETGLFITDIINDDHNITITKSTPDEIYKISAVPTNVNEDCHLLFIGTNKTDYPKYTEFVTYNDTVGKLQFGFNITLTDNGITANNISGVIKPTMTDLDTKSDYYCALPFIDLTDGGMPTGKPIDTISPEVISFTKSTSNNTSTFTLSMKTSNVYSQMIANKFVGTATKAEIATSLEYTQATVSQARNVWFSDSSTPGKLVVNDSFKYNPSTGVLFAPTFSGNLTGTADNAVLLNNKAENTLSVSHASTATQAASLGTNAGSLYWPVYFNNGKPDKIELFDYSYREVNNESHTETFILFNDQLNQGLGSHSKLQLITEPESQIRLELIKIDDTTPSCMKADIFDGLATNAVRAAMADNAILLNNKAESALSVSHASTAHILVASSNMAGICVGLSTHPIYFNNGNPQPCNDTISLNTSGTAAIARAVYCTSTSTNNNYSLVLSYSNNDTSNNNKELRHTYNGLVYNPVEYKLIMTGNNLITNNKHGTALPKLSIQPNIYDSGDPSEIGHAPKGQFIISTEESDNSNKLLFRCKLVEFSNSVTANSFNANSDKRLKANIKEIADSISATDILTKTNIYTFNYLNNMTEKSIGIIAQELEDIDINGFKLVNQDEKGYLSVKESKLVYLLIQGFKEQVKEIETLKEEIKKLKEKQGE